MRIAIPLEVHGAKDEVEARETLIHAMEASSGQQPACG